MTSDTSRASPFWPSRRLWLKLLLALICSPSFVVGELLLLAGAFTGGSAVNFLGFDEISGYLIAFLGIAVMVGGPVLISLSLSLSGRGAGAGLLAVVIMLVTWYFASVANDASRYVNDSLQLALTAGSAIAILELIMGGIRNRHGLAGLGLGLLVGLLLVLANSAVVGPFHYGGPRKNELWILSWSVPFALVWLSSLFFPELLSRRVGWGGVLVWAGLVGLVFGVSLILMK